MKTYIFKVRGIEQSIDLHLMSDKAARKKAKDIFIERGFFQLKLSEIKLINKH